MHPHLSGDMRQHYVTVLKLHAKHRIRQRLYYLSFNFYELFFTHLRLLRQYPGTIFCNRYRMLEMHR